MCALQSLLHFCDQVDDLTGVFDPQDEGITIV
jgi:hypothetical protein